MKTAASVATRSARKTTPRQVDLEARGEDSPQLSLKLWLRLLACTYTLESAVRARLKREFGISLARFDLLAQLERAPEGLKMSELSRRLMVTGGNVTGLTDQLEKEGLVVRTDDPHDRRAYAVKLTAVGRALFDRMATRHAQWIEELLAGLNRTEKASSYRLLAKLKRHVTDNATQER